MSLKSKQILFKVKDMKGKSYVAKGALDFLESKYKEDKKLKEYNFEKFTNGISSFNKAKDFTQKLRGNFATATSSNDPTDFSLENDPIQIDNSDAKFLSDNEDAIIFDLNRKKNS